MFRMTKVLSTQSEVIEMDLRYEEEKVDLSSIDIKIIDNLDKNKTEDLEAIAKKLSEFFIRMIKRMNAQNHSYNPEQMKTLCNYESTKSILECLDGGYLVYAESEGIIIGARMIILEDNKYRPKFFYILPEYRKGTNLAMLLSIPIAQKLREMGVDSYEFMALNFPETLRFYRSIPNIQEIGPTDNGMFVKFRKYIRWKEDSNQKEMIVSVPPELSM
ncbi:hypothetical protein GF312_08235 [Candidatus Poribacteria bacterium]|nr:hypothetical protein [Candidatus Poribacteria bacterium]